MSNSNNIVNNDNEIDWSEVLKKEARGIDESDFGKVQEITLYYILTERGLRNKDKFYLPRELVEGFDGDKLIFAISESDAEEKFKRDSPPSIEEYTIFKKKNNSRDSKQVEKRRINKKNANSLKINPSYSREDDNSREGNSDKFKQTGNLTDQKKKSKQKNNSKQKYEGTDKEEKARQEAEKRAREISKEVEDKARIEAENKTKPEKESTKIINHRFQEEGGKFEMDDQQDEFFNPFFAGIEIWQNYSIYWINKSKEIFNTATNISKDFGNTMKQNWTINPLYENDKNKVKVE
jgi:hypothetical protein